jgi:hypothetical protein
MQILLNTFIFPQLEVITILQLSTLFFLLPIKYSRETFYSHGSSVKITDVTMC